MAKPLNAAVLLGRKRWAGVSAADRRAHALVMTAARLKKLKRRQKERKPA
jgi:hypothetical protein